MPKLPNPTFLENLGGYVCSLVGHKWSPFCAAADECQRCKVVHWHLDRITSPDVLLSDSFDPSTKISGIHVNRLNLMEDDAIELPDGALVCSRSGTNGTALVRKWTWE